jgi:hypothetical protein
LIHCEPGFREQMEGRMEGGIKWEDITQWWGRRVQWGGVTMYGIIMEIWEGFAIEEVTINQQRTGESTNADGP